MVSNQGQAGPGRLARLPRISPPHRVTPRGRLPVRLQKWEALRELAKDSNWVLANTRRLALRARALPKGVEGFGHLAEALRTAGRSARSWLNSPRSPPTGLEAPLHLLVAGGQRAPGRLCAAAPPSDNEEGNTSAFGSCRRQVELHPKHPVTQNLDFAHCAPLRGSQRPGISRALVRNADIRAHLDTLCVMIMKPRRGPSRDSQDPRRELKEPALPLRRPCSTTAREALPLLRSPLRHLSRGGEGRRDASARLGAPIRAPAILEFCAFFEYKNCKIYFHVFGKYYKCFQVTAPHEHSSRILDAQQHSPRLPLAEASAVFRPHATARLRSRPGDAIFTTIPQLRPRVFEPSSLSMPKGGSRLQQSSRLRHRAPTGNHYASAPISDHHYQRHSSDSFSARHHEPNPQPSLISSTR